MLCDDVRILDEWVALIHHLQSTIYCRDDILMTDASKSLAVRSNAPRKLKLEYCGQFRAHLE